MKVCPQCSTKYPDDTLSFCLNDGKPLVAGPQSDMPTVVLGETETFVARSGYGAQGPPPSEVTRIRTFEQPPPKSGSNTAVAVMLTAIGMLVLFGVIGIAALLYMNSGATTVANGNTNATVPTRSPNTNVNAGSPSINTSVPASPVATVSAPQTNTNTPVQPSPVVNDDGAAKTEIPQRVYAWKSLLESRNLEAYMDNYAPTLDRYYTRSGMSRGEVRADKARAFNRFSSMRVSISNLSVESDGPSAATATFDKEWSFSGDGASSGKVRSQLKFREVGGKWLIVSERDVRVYYTR